MSRLLAALAFVLRMQVLKNQRDNAREKVDVLKTSLHVKKTQEKIVKEREKEKKEESLKLSDSLEKKGEDFKGVDNLTNPNDW